MCVESTTLNPGIWLERCQLIDKIWLVSLHTQSDICDAGAVLGENVQNTLFSSQEYSPPPLEMKLLMEDLGTSVLR